MHFFVHFLVWGLWCEILQESDFQYNDIWHYKTKGLFGFNPDVWDKEAGLLSCKFCFIFITDNFSDLQYFRNACFEWTVYRLSILLILISDCWSSITCEITDFIFCFFCFFSFRCRKEHYFSFFSRGDLTGFLCTWTDQNWVYMDAHIVSCILT